MAAWSFLGLGSNQAKPLLQLNSTVAWLNQHKAITLHAVSPVYQSPALTLPSAEPQFVADYLNAVVAISTELSALELLGAIKQQELAQGRDLNAARWSSRPIDIDILLIPGVNQQTKTLTLPHYAIAERDFVLLPWSDIASETVIPQLGTVADCAAALTSTTAKKIAESLSFTEVR